MSANKSSNFKNTEDGNGRDKGSAGANTKPSKPQQGVSIAVSSRALFDMEEERKIYEKVELERYVAYQQQHKDKPLKQGVAFQFVQALLAVNTRLQELDSNCKKLFNVILMSSNDTRVGLRLSNGIKKYDLDIERFSLTGGESPVEYLKAYETKLYLSLDAEKVRKATEQGIKAVLPTNKEMASSSETRTIKELNGIPNKRALLIQHKML
ncbi:hypothetical protein AGOR_G00103330 [Albula goreensis]|uniref:Uncharacterized protein n=1 Tax=Albula goreensis TaxID=1534307 RepID=A0A8T3DCG9_9TELE|nr:hypothetical protein AGOR_G00103330 [Albula goreensis]